MIKINDCLSSYKKSNSNITIKNYYLCQLIPMEINPHHQTITQITPTKSPITPIKLIPNPSLSMTK